MRSTFQVSTILLVGLAFGLSGAGVAGSALAQGPGGAPGSPMQRMGGGRAQAGASLGMPGSPMTRMGRGSRPPIGANSSLPQSRSSGARMPSGRNAQFLPPMPGMGGGGVGVTSSQGLKANALNAGRGAGLGISLPSR